MWLVRIPNYQTTKQCLKNKILGFLGPPTVQCVLRLYSNMPSKLLPVAMLKVGKNYNVNWFSLFWLNVVGTKVTSRVPTEDTPVSYCNIALFQVDAMFQVGAWISLLHNLMQCCNVAMLQVNNLMQCCKLTN